MKKLIFFFFILMSCVDDTEVKTTHDSVKKENTDGQTSLVPCETSYKWYHDGTTSSSYLVNGYYNGSHYDVILNPQWSAGGGIFTWFPYVNNVVFKMRVLNAGPNSFRYRIDGGSWVTLAGGQNGAVFTRTAWGHSPCDNNYDIGPIIFSLDVERLSCGSSPYNMNMRLNIVSISNAHNYGQPGGAINGTVIGLDASGTTCNI